MVAMVLPWKESRRVMMRFARSGPSVGAPASFFICSASTVLPYFLAVLMATSLASAPELQKKAFAMPVRDVSSSASRIWGMV